jgi:hypothetical protein
MLSHKTLVLLATLPMSSEIFEEIEGKRDP